MAKFKLEGLGVALITPFKKDKKVDFDALGNLLDYLMDQKADFLVVLGTTGETPTLSASERKDIIEFVKYRTSGKIPLVLGLGGNNTMELVETLQTDDFAGFEAILSVVPPYNKPTQEGIYQHYRMLSEASPLPLILYNVPGRTGVNMTAETTLRIAGDCKNVIGIKEASGDLRQIEEIIRNKPDGFDVISGDDSITLTLMKMGATGVISVIGNAFPLEFGKMVHYCQRGRYDLAEDLDNRFSELLKLMFVDGNPAGVKCVLSLAGKIENELRLPLVPVRRETSEKIKACVGPCV